MSSGREKRLDRAWAHLDEGNVEAALDEAESLLRERPDDPEALVLAAHVRLDLGDLQEALSLARKGTAQAPELPVTRLTLAAALYETCAFEEGLTEVEAAHARD